MPLRTRTTRFLDRSTRTSRKLWKKGARLKSNKPDKASIWNGQAPAMSPWMLGFHNATAMKINVGIGLLVAYFAALELFLIYDSAPQQTPSRRQSDT
jgi:hypothetical protein